MAPPRRMTPSQARRRSTIQPSSQISSQQSSQQARTEYESIGDDLFPLLPPAEIADLLAYCYFEVNEELIKKPTSSFVFSLYEQLLEQCLAIPIGRVETVARRIARDGDQQDEGEVDESEMVMNRYMVLTKFFGKFLKDSGFHDFGLFDVAKPDPLRTQRILSAVSNYLRFREHQSPIFEEIAHDVDLKMEELADVQEEHNAALNVKQELEDKYGKTPEERQEKLRAQNAYNALIERDVEQLQQTLQVLEQEYNEYERNKLDLKQKFEDLHGLVEVERIKIKSLQEVKSTDIKVLQDVMNNSKSRAAGRQQEIERLKQVKHNYETTIRSIETVEQELHVLLTLSRKLKESNDDIDSIKTTIRDVQNAINDLNPIKERLEEEVKNLEHQFVDTNTKLADLNKLVEVRSKQADDSFNASKIEYERGIAEIEKTLLACEQLKISYAELENDTSKIIREYEDEEQEAKEKLAQLSDKLQQYMQVANPILQL
ncbi:uncharacterized protein SPAPADRAFT_50632 [Spathaspora passalidarum NRRL Y-27907]|uniref:Kinetochore protein Nuf2 N-terminal domain-containing protein n=1 Tax=Spathaspora passalidarum (strain NRRL Y-27907 / 11-Y1) TaxID=619300 RepID=G3AP04_SPAPN|nr:uncharacterized protein SPAPADRAFT_50632 [Spathaspora passalidarum NRRL Y-27907]EGW32035.1 hypothetical protein SPAPADRAFT_50632 [Spathaspora passalidarum NRRL Y-27907]